MLMSADLLHGRSKLFFDLAILQENRLPLFLIAL
jgi:hypothetical protein